MKSNIKLKVAFCNISDKKFAILSTDQLYFSDYLNGMRKTLLDIEHTINVDEIVIQTVKHKTVHKALELLDLSETILTAENISNVEQLHIWLAIKAGTYEAKNDWDLFLQENDLLNDWIEGDLKLVTAYSYSERSKEFGYKSNLKKIESKLNTYADIWSLPEIFKGSCKTTHGTYAKYSYTNDSKIIQMIAKNRTINLNQQWLEEKEPSKTYRFSEGSVVTV